MKPEDVTEQIIDLMYIHGLIAGMSPSNAKQSIDYYIDTYKDYLTEEQITKLKQCQQTSLSTKDNTISESTTK